jgi:predicted  nucleic acid-binding Zn-ribbon protein
MQTIENITTKTPVRYRGSRRDYEIDKMLAEFPALKQEITTLKAEIASLNAKLHALKDQKKGNTTSFD